MATRADFRSGEDRLIAQYFGPWATHPGALGLGDDAAFVKPPADCDLVLTTDALVEGVHFFKDDEPGTLARKALRVNLSDLAAKGARPLGFMLSLALPQESSGDWLREFAEGLKADAEAFFCPLFGGDTVRSPVIMLSVAMFGAVPDGTMVRRAGATAGDSVMVTGTIGDAALGLKARRDELPELPASARKHLVSRYLLPQPRTALGEAIRLHASAAMDVSDGLAGDLAKLCAASGVAAQVDAGRIPLSDAAKAALASDLALIETILTGGDDYEVVCAVAPDKVAAFAAAAKTAGVALTKIGSFENGEGAKFIDAAGKPLQFKRPSFSHF
ncbi:MAG: thiamine-phosphate kinase [Pseudolabrys sp.]